MKRKLLFVNQRQFGYHTNYYNYCKYLKDDFDITYLCCDYGYEKITEEGIKIIYISYLGNIIKRKIHFFNSVFKLINNQQYHYIFIKYFRGCSIIPLFIRGKHSVHLNIITGSLSSNYLSRNLSNLLLRYESHIFKNVSIISQGLQKLLKVSEEAYILPLGANPVITDRKPRHKISLLYVGTFQDRSIGDTIAGLGIFIRNHPGADVHYTIIGSGLNDEINQIKDQINKYDLHKYVELTGYVAYKDLVQYYAITNVGVCYIPVTPWYEYQPSTKTFEYLMAGMPVIATSTYENKQVINDQNGLIIADTPSSFANSLEVLYDRIGNFRESIIRESVADYKWETIISQLKESVFDFKES